MLSPLRVRRIASFVLAEGIPRALANRGLLPPPTAQLLVEDSLQQARDAAEIARDELRAGRLTSARQWQMAVAYYQSQAQFHMRRVAPIDLIERIIPALARMAQVQAEEIVGEQNALVEEFEQEIRKKRNREIEALRSQLAALYGEQHQIQATPLKAAAPERIKP